jgi:glycolate oxidase iron-sulfur subunit
MRAVARGEMDVDDPAFAEAMYYCVGCRACETACPAGVEFGHLLEDARAAVEETESAGRPPAFPRELLLDTLVRPGRLRLGARLLRFYQRTLGQARWWSSRLARRRPDLARLLSLAPAVPPQSRRWRLPAEIAPSDVAGDTAPPARGAVAMHPGCVQAVLYPEVNADTAQVLAYNGWRVVVPEAFRCCGALHAHQGRREEARALARINVTAFEAAEAERLVSNAAGCGAFLKEYGALLEGDPEWSVRAAAFAASVVDVTEQLVRDGVRRPLRPFGIRVTYDDPCHLIHGQRVVRAPRLLLSAIPGIDLVPLAESSWCCGSAGVYNLTHPDAADRLGERKVERIVATGAELVATGNPGCMLQISAGLRARGSPVRVLHPVSLLRAAYELPPLLPRRRRRAARA